MDEQRAVSTDGAPAAIGPYSQAIVSGGLVFTAGQIALDPTTGELVGGGGGGGGGGGSAASEAERVLDNLAAVLEAAGSNLAGVLKTTVYLADLDDYSTVNDVYARYFNEPYPARSAVEVAGLPRGARVEIDAIARVP